MQIVNDDIIIAELKDEALKSTHDRVMLSAGLIYKNRLIYKSHSANKSHPFQKRFSKNEEAIFFHAETSCIHKALQDNFKYLHKSTMVIFRVKWMDNTKSKLIYGLAKPCKGCMKAINQFLIPTIIYTVEQTKNNTHWGVLCKSF